MKRICGILLSLLLLVLLLSGAAWAIDYRLMKNSGTIKVRGWVSALAFSPDSLRLAVGANGTLFIYTHGQSAPEELTGVGGQVSAVAFSRDGGCLAAGGGGEDPDVRVWDLEKKSVLYTIPQGAPARCIEFSPNGKWVAVSSGDMTIKVCDTTSGRIVWDLGNNDYPVNALRFVKDGTYLEGAGGGSKGRKNPTEPDPLMRGEIAIWDMETGVKIQHFYLDRMSPNVALTYDGRTLAGSDTRSLNQARISLWHVPAEDEGAGYYMSPELADVSVVGGGRPSIAFSPDGKELAIDAGHADQLWDGNDVYAALSGTPTGLKVRPLAWSPNGKVLACGGMGVVTVASVPQ